MNTCKLCGIHFEKSSSKRGYTSYCSDKCQFRYWINKNPERHKKISQNTWLKKPRKNHACCICGFNRSVDFCHIKWRKDGGSFKKENIYILCPNHHRLFDRGKLTHDESLKLVNAKDYGL